MNQHHTLDLQTTAYIIDFALELQRLAPGHILFNDISLFPDSEPSIAYCDDFFERYTPEDGDANDALVEFLDLLQNAVDEAQNPTPEVVGEKPRKVIVDD